MSSIRRKRIRDPLATTVNEFKYFPETSSNCYLEGSLALRHPDSSQIKAKRKQGFNLHSVKSPLRNMDLIEIPDGIDNSPGFYSARRDAIHYFYILFGSPSEDQLSDGEVVSEICRRLIIPSNSRRHVLNVLKDIIELEGNKYSSKRKHEPSTRAISDHDEEAELIMDYMEKGLGITQTTFLVNINREKNNKDAIARNTVENYIQRTELIERSILSTKVS